jgi:hypothetical protein
MQRMKFSLRHHAWGWWPSMADKPLYTGNYQYIYA